MPDWVSSLSAIVLAVTGVAAAAVVFVNNALTARKLQLEIADLKRQLDDAKHRIHIPTPQDVERVMLHLAEYNESMARNCSILERTSTNVTSGMAKLDGITTEFHQTIHAMSQDIQMERLESLVQSVKSLEASVRHATSSLDSLRTLEFTVRPKN